MRRPASLFLHDAVRSDVEERLAEVNKVFTAPAIVTPYPQLWTWEGARVVQDTETLDLEAGAHDLVIHALCLHWSDDPVGQLVQARRALKPDGLFIAVLFAGQTLHELRTAFAEAEVRVRGGLSPRVVPMAEIRDLGALLQRAGFALPVADSQPLRVLYDTPRALVRDLRAMGETNALFARDKTPVSRRLLKELEDGYVAGFGDGSGKVAATFDLHWLTAWAPGPGQPRPARRGSASRSLAEALGTEAFPAGDAPPPSD